MTKIAEIQPEQLFEDHNGELLTVLDIQIEGELVIVKTDEGERRYTADTLVEAF